MNFRIFIAFQMAKCASEIHTCLIYVSEQISGRNDRTVELDRTDFQRNLFPFLKIFCGIKVENLFFKKVSCFSRNLH